MFFQYAHPVSHYHNRKQVIGEIQNTKSPAVQEHLIGPVLYHEINLGGLEIDYNLGWLFGLTDGSTDNTFRWQLEIEFD
jgi:hypothetical protein